MSTSTHPHTLPLVPEPAPAEPSRSEDQWFSACTLETLKQRGCVASQGVAVFLHEGKTYAVDNRCPHMGFPLSEGTVKGGVLTCHWHAWQFDLESGGCLTPSEGDVAVYPTKVESGQVFVNKRVESRSGRVGKSRTQLDRALKTSSSLEASKAVYRLLKAGVEPSEIVTSAAELGLRFQSGFSSGLVTLTALSRVLSDYEVPFSLEQRVLGLIQAMSPVASETQGTAPRRFRGALPASRVPLPRLKQWFRGFLEDRENFGAERTLRTAFESGGGQADLVGMVVAGATDHVFIGTGHTLDFANKACELLDIIGWQRAPDVLTALIRDISESTRHEEDMSWKHPTDLIAMIRDSERELAGINLGDDANGVEIWDWAEALTELEPAAGFPFLVDKLRSGHGLVKVATSLAGAAVLRMHRFHTRNEFFDWDTVHHLLTHTNALLRLCKRFPSEELARGLLHAYGYLYLTRFLNVPPARLPEDVRGAQPDANVERLGTLIELRRIEEAGVAVYTLLRDPTAEREVKRTLAISALREDLGFHTWQQLEACFSLHQQLPEDPRRSRPLSSLARWLGAHAPTPRALYQTVDNAIRLERGDRLYED